MRYSIIITCYNQRAFIREAVNSAMMQFVDDTEVIVVDDASNDGSLEILKEFGNRIKFCQMGSNGGPSRARNLGASRAVGKYLVFLDGDDVLMPHALTVYDLIIEARRPMLILAALSTFSGPVPSDKLDETTKGPLDFVEYPNPMSKDRAVGLSASGTIVERTAFLNVGGWTHDLFHGDCKDLLMKLGFDGSLIVILGPKTVYYRIHETNSIHNVSSFLDSAHRLITNERAGKYPGGGAHAFERHAALGVYVFYWSMRGVTAGLWREVMKLALIGFPMVLAGVAQRSLARFKGLRPAESINN